MKRLSHIILFIAMLALTTGAWGGNRDMIERRVKELDRLNREVIQQVPDLPRNGQVHIRAKIAPDGRAEVLEAETIRTPRVATPAPVTGDESVPSLRSALRDRARGAAQIRPYRDDNSDGLYPRMRDALVAALPNRP